MRSRLYLSRSKDTKDDAPVEAGSRALSRKKSNFASIGDVLDLQWRDGVFLPTASASNPFRRSADDVFLALLDAVTGEGQKVSAKPRAGNNAPGFFYKAARQRARRVPTRRFRSRHAGPAQERTHHDCALWRPFPRTRKARSNGFRGGLLMTLTVGAVLRNSLISLILPVILTVACWLLGRSQLIDIVICTVLAGPVLYSPIPPIALAGSLGLAARLSFGFQEGMEPRRHGPPWGPVDTPMAALTAASGDATADLETLGAGMRSRSGALMAIYPTDEQAAEHSMAMGLFRTASSGRLRSNERYRASRSWLLAFIILDTQSIRNRPLCCGRDSHLICIWWGMKQRPVIDIRTAGCRKSAKLIEPCRRCSFEFRAAGRNFLHERCQRRLTASRVVVHRLRQLLRSGSEVAMERIAEFVQIAHIALK